MAKYTDLKKPVRRAVPLDRRGVVVSLYPNHTIGLRTKRCKQEYTLPLVRVWRWAIAAHQAAAAEEKRKARGGKRLVARGLRLRGNR